MTHNNATEQQMPNAQIRLTCQTDAGLGAAAKLGVVVLQSDQTLEYELRSLLDVPGVAWYHSRIPNAMHVSKDTLAQMAADLPTAVALLPTEFAFDAIAYACTSGATVIGEQKLTDIVHQSHPSVPVTNPLTACKAAFNALGLQRIALLTPYNPEVTQALKDQLQASGFDVVVTGFFDQSDDFVVGRISSDSILEAIDNLAQQAECDGVFVSCTSLRVAHIIEQAETLIDKPVTSSNHALAWHLLRLAGITTSLEDRGQLFKQT